MPALMPQGYERAAAVHSFTRGREHCLAKVNVYRLLQAELMRMIKLGSR